MSTTALVIEHLITGLQSAIWILLLILTAFGWKWINLSILKDFSTIITFVGLAAIYPVGIFVDELADYISQPWMKRIRDRRFRLEGFDQDNSGLTAMYLLQRTDDEFLKTYFNYIRMRIRVSRSTALNLVLTTAAAVIFTVVRFRHSQGLALVIFAEILIGVLSTTFAVWFWSRVSNTFAKQLVRALKTNPSLISKYSENWLEKLTGSISDEAAFLEALEYGRAFRQADKLIDKSDEQA